MSKVEIPTKLDELYDQYKHVAKEINFEGLPLNKIPAKYLKVLLIQQVVQGQQTIKHWQDKYNILLETIQDIKGTPEEPKIVTP